MVFIVKEHVLCGLSGFLLFSQQIEQREEHTYANLRTISVPSVYDQLKVSLTTT